VFHYQYRFFEDPMVAIYADPTETNAATASSLLLAVNSSEEHNPQIF
jgi:hypothetical protein